MLQDLNPEIKVQVWRHKSQKWEHVGGTYKSPDDINLGEVWAYYATNHPTIIIDDKTGEILEQNDKAKGL